MAKTSGAELCPGDKPRELAPTARHAFGDTLVEREAEISTLETRVHAAGLGTSAVVLIEGDPGIGKSRLLEEARRLAAREGFEVLSARGTELEQGFPFGVVRQLFEPLLARAETDREALFGDAAHLAAPLFPTLQSDALPPSDSPHAVLHGLYWVTVNAAGERPLMLCIDDAHWADAPSLRALAYLVNRMAELPLLVLVGMRPFEPNAELDLLDEIASNPSAETIRPRPLSVSAVAQLISASWSDEAAAEFVHACWSVTGGNPFFLREVLAVLESERLAPTTDNASVVAEIAPRTLARSVKRRLNHLPPVARALAEALAVLGAGAELSVAAALAEVSEADAMTAAEVLRRVDLLAEGTLDFIHPVVRSVIHAELPPGTAPARHAEAAKLLAARGADDASISAHLLATVPATDPSTVEVLRRAAERARAQGAPDISARYLHRALAEPPRDELRAQVLLELGLSGPRSFAGFDYLHEALAAATSPVERARIALEFARVLFSYAEFAQVADVIEQGRAGLNEGDSELAAELDAWLLGAAFWDLSVYERMSEGLSAVTATAPSAEDPLLLATASALEVTRHEPASRGAELARRALSQQEITVAEMPVLFAATSSLLMADAPDEAVRVWDAAVAEARRIGAIPALGFALTARARSLIRLGRIAAAEADARYVIDTLEDAAAMYAPAVIPPLIESMLERGEIDAAARLLDEFPVTVELPAIMPINSMLASAGRLRLLQGRAEEAIQLLRECGRRLDAWGILNPAVVSWRSDLALALLQVGDHDAALALANEEIDLARRFEVPGALGVALRAAALIENGNGTRTVDLLREAVETLESTPATLEHARALTDLGAALRRRGQRSEARGPLRQGLDAAQRCGATALAERAHTELVATGARPRRLMLSGLDSLTVSERRVAALAADGMTNRQIAQALFVTEKTVEGHLRHTYRKLDIGSRSELPRALDPDGPAGS
jgi:DNA-binding CsgD family transcriptional regulator/tetratricopeptide (TPR) repeat protein